MTTQRHHLLPRQRESMKLLEVQVRRQALLLKHAPRHHRLLRPSCVVERAPPRSRRTRVRPDLLLCPRSSPTARRILNPHRHRTLAYRELPLCLLLKRPLKENIIHVIRIVHRPRFKLPGLPTPRITTPLRTSSHLWFTNPSLPRTLPTVRQPLNRTLHHQRCNMCIRLRREVGRHLEKATYESR